MRREWTFGWLKILPCAILLILGGCGGGGNGGSGDGGIAGYTFTSGNMVEGASSGADAIGIFPEFSTVLYQIVDAAQSGAAPTASPQAVLPPIPITGLCTTGSATLVLDDKDNNLTLSAGDTATLTFTGCQLAGDTNTATLDGTVAYAVAAANLPASLSATVQVNLQAQATVAGQPQNETFSGSFLLQATTQSGTSLVTVIYGGKNRSDVLTATLDGQTTRFGCFDVTHVFSPNTPGTFTLQPRGIANVDGKIMQIGSYIEPGDPPLTFDQVAGFNDSVPISGSLTLLSFDGRPSAGLKSCTAVGSPGEVTSDNTYLTLIPMGDGTIEINLYDGGDNLLDQQSVSWTDLY